MGEVQKSGVLSWVGSGLAVQWSVDAMLGLSVKHWPRLWVLTRCALAPPCAFPPCPGFLQQAKGTRLSLPPPSLTSATLTISPNLDKSNTNEMRVPIKIDPAYGSFHVNVTVPENAEVMDHSLALQLPAPSGGNGTVSEGSDSFSVKDPRPPTAVLNVTAPDWVRGGRALAVGWKPVSSLRGGVVPDCAAQGQL